MKKPLILIIIYSILPVMALWAVPGDVITEDSTTDPGLPYAVVDGDLVIEDTDGNNSATPGLYVEGLSNLQGGLMLEGMDVIPLYASGGAFMSGNMSCKIVLGEQEISSSGWGLSILMIDRSTGAMLSHNEYNLWSSSVDYDRMANDLAALEDGSVIVVITSTFVWSIGWMDLNEELLSQIQRMGASSQINDHYYSTGDFGLPFCKNYVLIGIPGIGAGNGIEVLNEDAPEDSNSPATTKTAEVSTLLIKAGADGKYVPIGLGNSAALNDQGDGVFQRVGIGTNIPSAELDVVGDAKISGNLTVGGNIDGNLTVAQGNLVTGGLATDTDGDSGVYSSADDTVSIATGGIERINIDADGLVLAQDSGITFADGSVMTQAPDKVVYINEGDDITAILSSEEENLWYRIGPGTFTLTADIYARNGCRYSGAGKNVTIIEGAAIVASNSSQPSSITVELLAATGNNWFAAEFYDSGQAEIVIRDCIFSGESLGYNNAGQTYWIYDSVFLGSNAFTSIVNWTTINAYNSTFNCSGSFSTLDGSIDIRANNCKFFGRGIANSGYIAESISATFYNCELNVSSSFQFAVEDAYSSGNFLFYNSEITGNNNFKVNDEYTLDSVEDEYTSFYNCDINGVLTTKVKGNAIIDAASVGIGTNTPTQGMKLDVDGNTNISGDLTVSGTINSSGQPVLVSTTPDLTAPTGGLSTDGGDSGIYSTAEDTVTIAAGGVERVHLDAAGNVGIGTNNPQEAFQVGTGVTIHDGGWKALTFNAYYDENATPNPTWNNFTDGYSGRITFDMENGAFRFITVPAALADEPNADNWNNPAIYIANNGNIGIGMTDVGFTETGPDEKLRVVGDVRVEGESFFENSVSIGIEGDGTFLDSPNYGTKLNFLGADGFINPDDGNNNWGALNSDPLWIARYNTGVNASELRVNIGDDAFPSPANDKFVVGVDDFNSGWTPQFTVESGGNVGIGTDDPQETLHVNGSLRVDGAVTMTRQGDISMGQFGVGIDQGF